MTMTYQTEPWFALLQTACQTQMRCKVAESLGVSAPLLSQVLNGSGKYGRGEASTHKLAEKVLRRFANLHPRLPQQPHQQNLPLSRKTTVTVEH